MLESQNVSPIVQGYEEEREKLLSMKKYLSYHLAKKTVTRISIEFESKKFGDKGYASISSPPQNDFLRQIVLDLEKSIDDKLDAVLTTLRSLNDSSRPNQD